MRIHSFPRYISSSIFSSFGVVAVWKSFLLFLFTIMNNVHHDCCFHSCYESSDLLLLLPQEKRGDSVFPPYMADLFLYWKCLRNCFSKLSKIFGRLVHVHLENNGVAHLISNTWLLKKILGNCKWCIPLKKGNPVTHKTVQFVALINYYAVNFCYWKVFLLYWS